MPSIPPTYSIIMQESFPIDGSIRKLKSFVRGLAREIKPQAKWTLANWHYVDHPSSTPLDGFIVAASGSLNPLGVDGACADPGCKIEAAERFARTAGVYANVTVIQDVLTEQLASDAKRSDLELFQLFGQMCAVKALAPMIISGAVQFRSPIQPLCSHHHTMFGDQIDEAIKTLTGSLASEIRVTRKDDQIAIDTGKLYDPSIVLSGALSPTLKRQIDDGRDVQDVGTAMFSRELGMILERSLMDTNSAAKLNASVLSASRLDMLALRAMDHGLPPLNGIDSWEISRSVGLPWIDDLTPTQVVELREEARSALPSFRTKLVTALRSGDEESGRAALVELKLDADRLSQEIQTLDLKGESRFRTSLAGIGISIAVYGFASDLSPGPVVLTSLLTLLGLLHSSTRKDQQDHETIKRQPAYVLLKARELASHRH